VAKVTKSIRITEDAAALVADEQERFKAETGVELTYSAAAERLIRLGSDSLSTATRTNGKAA
jgi:hypothetical protein